MEKTLEAALARIAELEKAAGKPDPLADGKVIPLSSEIKELLGTPEAIEEMGRQAQEKAQDVIKFEKRKMHVIEFASKLVGGTREKPYGLPIRAAELVALLLALQPNHASAVEKILEKTWENIIDFREQGLDSNDFVQRRQLPDELKRQMKVWVTAGKTPESFFDVNPEAGLATDFNLTEFQKKEKA